MQHMSNSTSGRMEEQGFSLLELLLVVGVGALLLLAGIGTYQLVSSGNTTNEAVRLIATIKQQTQRAFQGQPNYGAGAGVGANDLTPTLVAMQAFPSGVVTAGVPRDPWGGAMDLSSDTSTNAGDSFSITFPAVPTASCTQVGTAFTESDTDFVALNAAGTVFNTANPVTTAALATACSSAATVAMTWTFF